MSGNLLVVDWDFFFPNPFDGGEYKTRDVMLYDWQHSESRLYIETLWPIRAAGFVRNGLPLPRCEGYQDFWSRFEIFLPATLLVADSNVWAGSELVESWDEMPWDSVWLYDAHHDCGYKHSSLEKVRENGRIECENWMAVHHERGSDLHVRYPQWKVHAFTAEPQPWFPVDRSFDDGTPPPVNFDTVFLCRSGAWVPPWNDDQFAEFVAAFPGEHEVIGPDMTRRFDMADVDKQVAAYDQLLAMGTENLRILGEEKARGC